jgi:putative acetyltransferase
MDIRRIDRSGKDAVEGLFTSVFTASEGRREGKLVGALASDLASHIDDEERICFGAFDSGLLIGAIFFTRLRFSDPIPVYMLAPVAVATERQGEGIGKALIEHGLNALKVQSVSVAVTYGDPAFYAKVGFRALSEDVLKAPLELSMPFGWLGQSLKGGPVPSISGRPVCVEEFNDPAYW